MAGVVLPLHGDDFACGRHHAPPQQIVQRGAVFEGAGTARVFRNVAADAGGQLGGRVHGEERSGLVHGLDGLLGDDPGLADHGHAFRIDGTDARQAGKADDKGALARGHGPARGSGTAAAGDDGELHVVGQPDHPGHLLRGVGFHHQQGQLHAQIRGVGGVFHQRAGAGDDAFVGQDVLQGADEAAAEVALGLVGRPEHGDALADGGGVVVGQGEGFSFIPLADALAYRIGVDERIVGYQKQLFRDLDGQPADGFRPFFKVVPVDTQDAVDDVFGRNGYMGAFMGHGGNLICVADR